MPSVVLQGIKSLGKVYCTSCTRTVDAEITVQAGLGSRTLGLRAVSGQKCPRCAACLDAAFVMANSSGRAA
jgi:hypothetical protein